MSKVIDGTTAVRLLEQAVAEKGADYVYPGADIGICDYAKDGAPSCIVGYAFNYFDSEAFDKLAELEFNEGGFGIEDYNSPSWHDRESGEGLAPIVGVELTDEAVQIFAFAQTAQDGGEPWGYALKAAIEVAERQSA